jgi:hypothetical protein
MQLARVAFETGDHEEAERLWHESLGSARRCGYIPVIENCLGSLSELAAAKGDFSSARQFALDAREARRATGRAKLVSLSNIWLAQIGVLAGDQAGARQYLSETFASLSDTDVWLVILALMVIADFHWCFDKQEQAVELLSLIERQPRNDLLLVLNEQSFQEQLAKARSALSTEVFDRAYVRGKTLDLQAVLADLRREFSSRS